ncbi:hypothetical protein GCM10029964_065630 [Kibdelosporangium lantanae]
MDDWWETSDVADLLLTVLRPTLTHARHLAYALEEDEWTPALAEALPGPWQRPRKVTVESKRYDWWR